MLKTMAFLRGFSRYMSTSLREESRRVMLDRIIRVDHAGEFAAIRIYEGQLSVLGKTAVGPLLQVSLIKQFCSRIKCYM